MRPAWLVIAGAEVRLLRRSAFTVTMAALLPTAIGLLIVWAQADTGRTGWGTAAGLLVVTLLTTTAYTAGTTTLAARRQQHVLKRLRLSGASDAAILGGVLAPLALLTVLQMLVLTLILPPANPVPLLLAAAAGTAAACGLAIATAAVTSAPELAQITTGPVALVFVGGAFWAARVAPADVTGAMLALPGVAVSQLTRIAWHEPGAGHPVAATLALIALTAVVTPPAVRLFRWDPRR